MAEAVVRPGQVDAAWLSGLLGIEVRAVTATAIGTGQVGATLRFRFDHDGNAPRSLVGKFASADPTSRAAAHAQGSYVRETGFYRTLAPGRALPIPHALYVAINEASQDFAIVMHDLPDHRAGDQLAGVTLNDAERAVDALAAIHAAFWNDASLETHVWLAGSASSPKLSLDTLYTPLWPAFCQRYADHVDAAMRALGDAYLGNAGAWGAPRDAPRTLIHGDFRPDNMLFAPDGDVVIVDWQTVGVGSGATDLSYFMGTSLAPAMRRAHERALFKRWCASVNGDTERLWRLYRRDAFAGFLMGVVASMIVERTDRGDAMFLAMCERAAAMITDHRSIDLI